MEEATGVRITVNDASETIIIGDAAEAATPKRTKPAAERADNPEQPAAKAEGGN